jgi:peptidyl-prolyl cis-trans isomerase D
VSLDFRSLQRVFFSATFAVWRINNSRSLQGSSHVLESMRGLAKYVWWILLAAFVGAFLLADMSGLIGQSPVTPTTAVAKVNGDEILYLSWQNAAAQAASQQEQRMGRSLDLDERRQIEDQVFDQMLLDVLLRQEYEKRGIRVTDQEIQDAALYAPPADVYQNETFYTEGRFDPEKYRRFLASPVARQQGLLVQLENYYRAELPRTKLFSQVAADAYVSDERLFQMFRDERDSSRVAFVAIVPTPGAVDSTPVTEAEARAFYRRYPDRWEREGRAVVSMVTINRLPSAADTAATRARLVALREEITSGRSTFEEVARRESADTISGPQGGDLGRGGRGRFVAEFERAAYELRVGQVSQPVLTSFGWHLIKSRERKGNDTIAISHILLRVTQQDSAATLSDRRADRLSDMAADASNPSQLDSAAAELGLLVTQVPLQERQAAFVAGRQVGGVSAWAFSGVGRGDISDLLDDENGYYLARIDSLTPGGVQPFEAVRSEIEQLLRQRKAVEALLPRGQALLADAQATNLPSAAAKAGLTVQNAGPFTRLGFVPGLGYANEAVGASFSIPVGRLGVAKTDDGVVVIQVEARTEASRAAFEAQKAAQRDRVNQALREQRVRSFMDNLRKNAKIVDRRRELNVMLRRQAVAADTLP